MAIEAHFNGRHTVGDKGMTVGELAESLRGVENPTFSDEDDPDGDEYFQKAYWRDSEIIVCLKDEDGKHEGFYVITNVGYSCISPEPYVTIKKKVYPKATGT